MGELVKEVRGEMVGRGEITKIGNYVVFARLDIKGADSQVESVENVIMGPTMASAIGLGVSFKFVDGKNLNTHYKQNFLCGMQTHKGDVLIDDKVLRYSCKTRYFLAYLSLVPPFTVIAPFIFKQAKRLKAAQEEVGAFEPLEKNFISPTKKMKS
jgi:hypothetical protein